MDGRVILVILPYLKDTDKLSLLSTCRTFRNMIQDAVFTEKHSYFRVSHLPFINSFANIYTEHIPNVSQKHIHLIRSLMYTDSKHELSEFLNMFTLPRVMFGAIPPNVKNLYVDTAFDMYSIIPEHVMKLVIYDEWERCIRIQDGEVVKNVQSKISCDFKRARSILRIKRKLHNRHTQYGGYGGGGVGGFDIFIKR